jgi:hypothetical protein
VQTGINFDQPSLAQSLLTGRSNPYVHLKFRLSRTTALVGMPDLSPTFRRLAIPAALLHGCTPWGSLAIEVQYVSTGGRQIALPDAWHPASGSNRFVITAPLDERESEES